MASKENIYFLRSFLLLIEGGSYISKEILDRECQKSENSLDELLKIHERKLAYLYHGKQYQKLFPKIGTADVNCWDLQLLVGVLINVFGKDLKSGEKDKLRLLKCIINETFMHSTTAALDESKYEEVIEELNDTITTLASTFDISVQQHCSNYIKQFTTGPLEAVRPSSLTTSNRFSQLCQKKFKVGVKTELVMGGPSSTWTNLCDYTLETIFNHAESMASEDGGFQEIEGNVKKMLSYLESNKDVLFKGCKKTLSNEEEEQRHVVKISSEENIHENKAMAMTSRDVHKETKLIKQMFDKDALDKESESIYAKTSKEDELTLSVNEDMTSERIYTITSKEADLQSLQGTEEERVAVSVTDQKKQEDGYTRNSETESEYTEFDRTGSLETSFKAEDATEIYKHHDDDEELDPFLCSGKVKSIKKLIESGRLPRQGILDEMCQIFGRKSKAIIVTCKAICEHIKSKHVAITHVWASYTIENPQRITFVITVKQKSEDDKSTKPVRLDKLIKYSYVKQYVGDFSLEGSEVIKQQTSASEKLDEESYQNLQSCISKHSEDLMKRHRNLSIISACSNRSKRFGESWELLPEKCIVFYVQKKSNIPIDEEPFERYYGGIAVDVREGAFIPFGRTAREKLDPIKMGCQIRGDLYEGQYVEGTLGCFVDHPQFGVCGLTCAHVLLSPWELLRLKNTYSGSLKWPLHDMYKNVYQPANQNSSIGHTVQFIYDEGSSTKSGMELALFKITDRQPKSANFPDTTVISASSVNNIKYDSWRICSTDRLNKKENLVIKFGSKTEFRHGTIMFDNTTVKNLDSYPLASGYAVIKLFKQIEVKTDTRGLDFAGHGDSGALVFLAENNSQYSCIGIVEGGTTYGTVVVTPIVPILEALKVHCLKSFESETNLTNIDNQIQSMHGDMQSMKCDLQSVRKDIKKIDDTLQTIAQSLRNNQQ